MSYSTARIIFLIATILWVIAILFPYRRFGVTERRSRVIKYVMGAIFVGGFITYAVTPP